MSQPAKSTGKKKHHRHWMKMSPLDKLPESVKADLREKVQASETFRSIKEWLKCAHGLQISVDSIWRWDQRQREAGLFAPAASSPASVVIGGGFEVLVLAPGASEIRVQLRPLPGVPAPKQK